MKRNQSLRPEGVHQHHCPMCGKDWDCWCWGGPNGEERQCLKCLIEAGKPKVQRVGGLRMSKLFSDINISEGGWNGHRWMTTRELRAAVKRWVKHSYETGEEQPGYRGFINDQCGGCRYFGAFDSDYGVCCNAASPNDGRITFEHGGCEGHSVLEGVPHAESGWTDEQKAEVVAHAEEAPPRRGRTLVAAI